MTRLPNGKRFLRGVLRAGFLLVLSVASFLLVFAAAKGVDELLGWLMPVSPWPALGMRNQPMLERTLSSYDFRYVARNNSMGLRGDEEPQKRPGVYRILAIGDSYTYGWGVDEEATWVRRIGRKFEESKRSAEIINAGMLGNGPVEYAQRAEFLVPQLQPDLVLVCILEGGDLAETPDEFDSYPNLTMLYRDWKMHGDAAHLQLPRVMVTAPDDPEESKAENAKQALAQFDDEQRAAFEKLQPKVKDAFLKGRLNAGIIGGAAKYPSHYVRETLADSISMRRKTIALTAILKKIRRIGAAYNAKVAVVLMPEGPYVNRPAIANWSQLGFTITPEVFGCTTPERTIQTACAKSGLDMLNLAPGFREHGDEVGVFFELDTHMTARGNALVAEILYPMLAEEMGETHGR